MVGDGKIYLVSVRGEATTISTEGELGAPVTGEPGRDVHATPALRGGLRTSGHLVGITALLMGVGLPACRMPARRAARIAPTEALRTE